ncbi:MAG: metallopeptidase family protein [Candidatus Eisenbacteria bacterium]
MPAAYETLTESEWEQVLVVWELLESGELERAHTGLAQLQKSRGRHPDLRIVEAALALEEGRPDLGLDALKGAERSADPAQFFHLRALAHFDLIELEAAREDAARAIAVRPEHAEAHDLLSRVLELLGDAAGSAEHAEEARLLDPEVFHAPLAISDEDFDAVVERCVRELPERVRKELGDVPVVVQPLPTRELLAGEDRTLPPDLLGLFVGRPLMERSHADVPGLPGSIYLFRRNLLRACADRDELEREIRITVQHEVGHLLGLDEDDLEEWGLA